MRLLGPSSWQALCMPAPAPGRNDFFRQLEITICPLETRDRATLNVWARVSHRGVDRKRLLLSVDIPAQVTDLDLAQTLAIAGEILTSEAFRMAQPAPQAPRSKADHSGRVATVLNRFRSLS